MSVSVGGSDEMTRGVQSPRGDHRKHQLTERRRQILDFIHQSTERRGHPPSMREIGDAVGLRSTSAVSHQLKVLEEMGRLTRGTRTPRTVVQKPPCLRVIVQRSHEDVEVPAATRSQNMVDVPVFEQIAAGTGVIANPGSHLHQGFQYSEDTMRLPREKVGSGVLFAVRVVGDSMVDASIFDGDYVVVRQQDIADDGDIVAALIGEEEATVKVLQRANGHVWLMPQNPVYKPILGDDCLLMGKVVAAVHRF
jgi:repressor LexA